MGSLIAACPCATSVSQLYIQLKMVRFALMFMDNSLGRRHRTGIIRTKMNCTYLSYDILNAEWVENQWVLPPPIFFFFEICGYGPFYKTTQLFTKFRFPPYKVSACCELNFDATMLPHSSFEALCPKHFRGAPKVDLT